MRIGTFNLNNLFSRFNFQAEIDAVADAEVLANTALYRFGRADVVKVRTYQGRLVKAKNPEATKIIAERILRMDVDVLAVQEVEDIDTLRQFNREYLGNLYRHVVLVEGNDPRLIDVGILSKLPIGGITSWQRTPSPQAPDELVFGRDLLEVDILDQQGDVKLFTLYNTHLKSHYVDFRTDPVAGAELADRRRAQQVQAMASIIKRRRRPDSNYIVVGDMNDPPDAESFSIFAANPQLLLINALKQPQETRPAKLDSPAPASSAWTHRFKAGGPARYELYDHIWLSPALAPKQRSAWIDRRIRHAGDGSDHDPAWIELEL